MEVVEVRVGGVYVLALDNCFSVDLAFTLGWGRNREGSGEMLRRVAVTLLWFVALPGWFMHQRIACRVHG